MAESLHVNKLYHVMPRNTISALLVLKKQPKFSEKIFSHSIILKIWNSKKSLYDRGIVWISTVINFNVNASEEVQSDELDIFVSIYSKGRNKNYLDSSRLNHESWNDIKY